jgi:Protein of unknown function (DUF1997)
MMMRMIVLSAAMMRVVFLFLGLFRRCSALRTTPSVVVAALHQHQQQHDLYRMRMLSSPAFITSQQRSSALDRLRGEHHALYAAASRATTTTTTASMMMMMMQQQEARRKVLLSRTGPHLKVDRMRGTIEFGATANLVTQLQLPPPPPPSTITTTTIDETVVTASTQTMIDAWLRDENRGLAMSIWDPQLMTYLGNDVYRLQIMTLQFVTITLAPWVDVQMRTTTVQQVRNKNQNDNHDNNDDIDNPASTPEFIVQSIGFEPNIQILPGMRVDAQSLGIVIEVAGGLRPGSDGTSVTGGIAFQTSGILPPPMRLIPDPILKAASDTINQTIVNFVIQNFRTGAQKNFQEFVMQQQRRRRRLQQEQQQQQLKEEEEQ